jgi:hypothetical protein
MLSGVVTPLTLNPVPFAATCETLTVPVPVLVRVACIVPLLPTLTFPKLRLSGLLLRRYDKPSPDSATVVGEVVALLKIVTVPVAFPPTMGVKLILKDACFPASKVKGTGIEEELKPAPATVTCEMVTVPVPEFSRVRLWVLLLPRFTFPKFMEEGVGVSKRVWLFWPRNVIGMSMLGALSASLTSKRLPLKVPSELGFTVALKVVLWPAGTVRGNESPERVKPAPDLTAWEMVTSRVPGFERVTA